MFESRMQGALDAPPGHVNVVDFNWPADHHHVDCAPRHRIGLSLSPVPRASRGRFRVAGCPDHAIGRLVFIPSGIPLEARNDGGFQRIAGCQFTPESFHQLTHYEGGWTVDQLSRSVDLKSERLRGTLRRIAQEVLTPGFGRVAVVESLMTILAVDLIRHLGALPDGPARAKGGMAPSKLARLEERVTAADMNIPSVSELAALCQLSSRHLLRGYREEMGESLRERLQRESGERAKQWLRRTDLPIKTIAQRLGFRCQSSFSTAFRNLTGESPRVYRQRAG